MLLYFTSEEIKNAEHLKQIGLGHIFETTTDLVRVPIFGGPQGFGVVWGSKLSMPESKIGYYPARQQVQSFGKFGIGFYTDETFRSESLLRPTAIAHHSWRDHLNREWRIPIARRWVEFGGAPTKRCGLPHFYGLGDGGEWFVEGVIDRYSRLWEIACEFDQKRFEAATNAADSDFFQIPLPKIDDVCDHVFGVNYRVSKFELSMLRVIANDTVYEVMKLVVDDPSGEQLQKKTELDTGNTSSGVDKR